MIGFWLYRFGVSCCFGFARVLGCSGFVLVAVGGFRFILFCWFGAVLRFTVVLVVFEFGFVVVVWYLGFCLAGFDVVGADFWCGLFPMAAWAAMLRLNITLCLWWF